MKWSKISLTLCNLLARHRDLSGWPLLTTPLTFAAAGESYLMTRALPLTLSLNWKPSHGKGPQTCQAFSQPEKHGRRFTRCWWKADMLLNSTQLATAIQCIWLGKFHFRNAQIHCEKGGGNQRNSKDRRSRFSGRGVEFWFVMRSKERKVQIEKENYIRGADMSRLKVKETKSRATRLRC